MAQTFALITPVHPVLHRVSCSYETIPNAQKPHATHQNMSLGSNGAGWVRSLRKIQTWLRGTNLCINCTISPKDYATHQNMSLWSNGADWVRSLQKIPMGLNGTNFLLIAPAHPVLHRVSCSYETIANAPKHYAMHQNMSLGSKGWIGCVCYENPDVTSWHELLL